MRRPSASPSEWRRSRPPAGSKPLYALIGGELAVEELAARAGLTANAVSQQLRVLRHLRLVAVRRDGRRMLYRLHDEHLVELLGAIRHQNEHAEHGWSERPIFRMATAHGHSHGLIDRSIKRSRAGLRAVGWSLLILRATAGPQVFVFVATGTVALLADLIHNVGDALTAVPLAAAFLLRSLRAERFAGYFVVARSSSVPASPRFRPSIGS